MSRIGWVRYFFADDRWEWSDEVTRMHGYEPGSVTPTTELVLSHKHPEDRDELIELLQRIRHSREPFSTRHRIRDTQGRTHHVVVVGNQLRDEAGEVIGSDGFYIDMTGDLRSAQEQVSNEVEDIAARRSPIDQAKGMLMMVYSISADAAFDLLRWRSQETNVKLRDLAQQVATDFQGVPHDGAMPDRSVYDGLLMTAHLRVGQD
ncbi:antitermination regulator [Mycolicibacterium rhodesiae]|uniref:histidine kinase n=1 Tax=Mycolicibacterium rhodesiae TaxID=36814 RepID=A0A1X0IPV4_MYCRH|nr:PAS and ANTAR domain-containing protein [Mycolicibacterium rhodesiae]ORB50484.1 antitermination regulator [Mycolicibacterium rhodesiae]